MPITPDDGEPSFDALVHKKPFNMFVLAESRYIAIDLAAIREVVMMSAFNPT